MNKLPIGSLNSPDFWCPQITPSIWTLLSLRRFLNLDASGMSWRHSQAPNKGPDPIQGQPGADHYILYNYSVYFFWLSSIMLDCTCTVECFCPGASWTSANEWLHSQTTLLWIRLGTTALCCPQPIIFIISCSFKFQNNWPNVKSQMELTEASLIRKGWEICVSLVRRRLTGDLICA